MDSESNLITLTDESGKEQTFEIVDTYEENDEKYYALLPYTEDYAEDESDELLVLKVEFDENGEEDGLLTIDNDGEYERIGNIFIERLNSMYDNGE